jgi:DNA polymerase-3 subunit epsilon
MREIVLDTETTGFDPANGDRIVEIGCIELVNHIPSGREWHSFIDPQRDMPQSAFEVHGLSAEFLTGKPLFSDIAEDFVEFIAGDQLVIHNAPFDIGFLNAELERTGHPLILMVRVTDTLALARRKHPGASNSLDALCKRYAIDNSERTTHGAVIDCRLLAAVYIELIGGHQAHLELAGNTTVTMGTAGIGSAARPRPEPLPPRLSEAERVAHRAFVKSLGPDALWKLYSGGDKGTPA